MSGASYPRNRIQSVLLRTGFLDCYRIVPRRFAGMPLGTRPADSRFCSKSADYSVLYTSPDFATAFLETVVRDRFARRRNRKVALREVTQRAWARISMQPEAELRLLDLRGDGCTRIGAPTDAVHARNHAAGRTLGKAIHAEHTDIDGLLYVSRLTGEDIYAVFDRATGKLGAVETGMLINHPDLPDVLGRHQVDLVQ